MILSKRVEDTVLQTLRSALGGARHASPVTHATTLSALGISSMTLLEMASQIEDSLAIELPLERVARARSVGELLTVVQESCALPAP